MDFNVALLLREPIGSKRVYRVDEQYEGEAGAPADLRGTVTLLRTNRSILATADLTSDVAATCSRCLAPTRVPVQLAFEEEYYPSVEVVTGAPLPPPEDSSAFRIDAHHDLDLDEAIRQQIVLAEPMQPLCRPDCVGLCPACGADRNLGVCACAAQPVDVRWATLAELQKRFG